MGAASLQDAVDLRSVFFDSAAPDSWHRQQLPSRSRPRAGHGSQCPVAENTEGRDSASSGLSQTPGAQRLFDGGMQS